MVKKAVEPATETGTEIAVFTLDNPVDVINDPKKFDDLVGKIEAEVESHVPDLTTARGRKAIISLAYKVTRTKTALDDAGKELNAAKRAEIDAVDEVRREVRRKLDDLAAKARKPLDEWEAAEEQRQADVSEKLAFIDSVVALAQHVDSTSSYIAAELAALERMEFDADVFQDALEIAINRKASALRTLRDLFARAEKAEKDAKELAELRAANAEREAREAEERAERERQEQAKRDEERREQEAREAEEKRLADIKAAEDRAAAEATAAAAAEAQKKIDEANAEAERLRQGEAVRQAEAKRLADEQAARDADTAHKSKVLKAAKESIMEHAKVDETTARAVVNAIRADLIPNVTLRF